MKLDEKLPWTARTKSEKARARRLRDKGLVTIDTVRENYMSRTRLVGYEAWHVQPKPKLSK